VAALHGCGHDLLGSGGDGYRDHLDARDHDLAHGSLLELHHVVEHLALFGFDRAFFFADVCGRLNLSGADEVPSAFARASGDPGEETAQG